MTDGVASCGTFSLPVLGGKWAARRQATLGQGSIARAKVSLTSGHDTENPWGMFSAPWISLETIRGFGIFL